MQTDVSAGAEKTTTRIPLMRSMRGMLLAWFVLLAIVPMLLVSVLFSARAEQALIHEAENKLVAVREIKMAILKSLFRTWQAEILFVSQLETLKSDLMDMAAGFKFLGPERVRSLYGQKPELSDARDGSAYSTVHQEEQLFFQKFITAQKYEDILLIDPEGNIFYTMRKGPAFGSNLTTPSYSKTHLGVLFDILKTSKPNDVHLSDTSLFNGDAALFMGTPVFQEDIRLGYLIFRLPMARIIRRIGEREGMGRTGETYLVGPDRRMRSNSFNDPEERSVKASLAGTVGKNGVASRAVEAALAGTTGTGMIMDYRGRKVLSSYAPVELNDLKWVILAEIDTLEALAPAKAVRRITAGLAAIIAVVAFLLSLFASSRIVRPIRNLTNWSRRIAAGELELEDIKAPDNEIGMLNESFHKAVKSLKAADISQQRHNWLKAGQAELDDRMRGEQSLELLCRKVVTFVTEYLDAQVGAFFLNDKKGVFRLKGSYAYKVRKNLSNEFATGEGLVGQAALEKQSILLTQVPDNYICISSGLGEKHPRNIFVVPLVYDNTAVAVIEIGSFSTFTEDQRAFLEETAERIAIAVHAAMARERLQDALDTTRQQSDELQAQQEELKTANEELEEQTQALRESEEKLKAQQEELQVTNEELEEKTDLLQRQKQDIEKANQELERAGAELEEKAEDLALASKYKSEFLANMSHELRTPLNSLLLLADVLSENKTGNLTDDQLQSASVIRDSGHQLLSLINEILDLAKIEAGRMEVHPEKIAVRDLGVRIENHFNHMAEYKGLEMTVSVDASAPAEIETDAGKAEQIIRNLVTNAIKFTETGVVAVAFTRPDKNVALKKSGLDPLKALAVSVKDTGIGISPDKQKVIFEAFQQAEGGTARRYGGTGLGLSISKELASLLGGEIQLESVQGEGSTFTLFLPEQTGDQKAETEQTHVVYRGSSLNDATRLSSAAIQSAPVPLTNAVADDREAISEGDKAILIIEDDARFAPLVQQECRNRGFKSIVAGSGEEGIKLAEAYLPAAIILDIRLPGMDGWAVLRHLKENPDLRHIPVHFMSVEEPTIEAFSKGAVGYLKKPVSRKDLEGAFSRLEDIIERKIKNLLVVEDDEHLRKGIVQLIGNGDVHTHEAATGKDALAAMRNEQYDCIILDLGLPDMSGFDVLKALKTEKSDTITPVIVYTGRDLSPQEERELMEHTDSIIIKGVKSEERLLDEASLFLHRMVGNLPEKKRKIITDLHDTDVLFRGKTLLMADDDMRNVFALSRILEEKGVIVIKAEDGRRALEVLEDHPDIDMVLMDIMMPVMDGYETMRRIRAQERFRQLPIIALTAKAMTKDQEQCIAAGASDYMTKPVDVQRLLSMMRVWLYR